MGATDEAPAEPARPPRWRRVLWILIIVAAALAIVWPGAGWELPDLGELFRSLTGRQSGPMVQEVYLWQRTHTPAVAEAVAERGSEFSRLVVRVAEVSWREGRPVVERVSPDYAALAEAKVPIGLAVRVRAYRGSFSADGEAAGRLVEIAAAAVAKARAAGLEVRELQIDFDCPTSKLDGYVVWVRALRRRVDVPVIVTALPSWLGADAFEALADEADGFVLQVHSFERPGGPDEALTLCDPAAAKRAVERAGHIGRPFRVALPTYGYLLAFDAEGSFISLSAEGPRPAWPANAQVRQVRANPAAMAELVRTWTEQRPKNMAGVIWYRLPVRGDVLNWRWPTLAAVMAGQTPKPDLRAEVRTPEPGLIEIDLLNAGTADAALAVAVEAAWSGEAPVAADAVNGFELAASAAGGVTFHYRDDDPGAAALPPGERITIGWIRLDKDKEVRAYVEPIEP